MARPRNAILASALTAAALCGALLPLAIVKGPLHPGAVAVSTERPLPRQAGVRGAYSNRCVLKRALLRVLLAQALSW